jgi:hypothetical protein
MDRGRCSISHDGLIVLDEGRDGIAVMDSNGDANTIGEQAVQVSCG